MARFEIRFLKEVCNDTGHARSVLQRVINVDADCAERASDEACALFCTHENVGHWRDHADRLEVTPVNGAESGCADV